MNDKERYLIALELHRFSMWATIGTMILVCAIAFIGASK